MFYYFIESKVFYHRKVLEDGVKETLNELRTIYWICRNFMRNIIKNCFSLQGAFVLYQGFSVEEVYLVEYSAIMHQNIYDIETDDVRP